MHNGKSIGSVKYENFLLKIYTFDINKVVKGVLVDSIELVVGFISISPTKAMDIIKNAKCGIDEIEPLFQSYELPDPAWFSMAKINAIKNIFLARILI